MQVSIIAHHLATDENKVIDFSSAAKEQIK